jgi:hypothetical protein
LIWLLLALSVNAQEVSSSTPSEPVPVESLEISNLGKAVRDLTNGHSVIPGQPRFIKGICFNTAGSDCQTTAATASAQSMPSVSSTTVAETVFTQATFQFAVATITVTTTDPTVKFWVHGAFFQNSTQDQAWSVYCDGAPCQATDLTTSRGMWTDSNPVANRCHTASGEYTVTGLTAGVHIFSLRMATNSGVNLRFVNGTSCGTGLTTVTKFGVEYR